VGRESRDYVAMSSWSSTALPKVRSTGSTVKLEPVANRHVLYPIFVITAAIIFALIGWGFWTGRMHVVNLIVFTCGGVIAASIVWTIVRKSEESEVAKGPYLIVDHNTGEVSLPRHGVVTTRSNLNGLAVFVAWDRAAEGNVAVLEATIQGPKDSDETVRYILCGFGDFCIVRDAAIHLSSELAIPIIFQNSSNQFRRGRNINRDDKPNGAK
jgi:hypothetical protein